MITSPSLACLTQVVASSVTTRATRPVSVVAEPERSGALDRDWPPAPRRSGYRNMHGGGHTDYIQRAIGDLGADADLDSMANSLHSRWPHRAPSPGRCGW